MWCYDDRFVSHDSAIPVKKYVDGRRAATLIVIDVQYPFPCGTTVVISQCQLFGCH